MRIVDREIFLEMEGPLLYSELKDAGDAVSPGEIQIRGDVIQDGNDFIFYQINNALDVSDSGEYWDLMYAIRDGEVDQVDVDIKSQRDGKYDANQRYCVWELEDVQQFQSMLEDVAENLKNQNT